MKRKINVCLNCEKKIENETGLCEVCYEASKKFIEDNKEKFKDIGNKINKLTLFSEQEYQVKKRYPLFYKEVEELIYENEELKEKIRKQNGK